MLYPTELRTEREGRTWYVLLQLRQITVKNGRGERIRTFDPLVPNQMRYQAALHPDSQYSNRSKRPNSKNTKDI
jgi:hypothetical protein